MNLHQARLATVSERISKAAQQCGRAPETVRLLAVSKQQTPGDIGLLHDLGVTEFGENRLPEAREKQALLASREICWHFIGPVQSNKTREIAAHFDWVQSVDRSKILRRLADQRPSELAPLNICLQVNIDEEPQKAGAAPANLTELASLASELPALRLRGLMCIPALTDDRAQTRASFQRLAALAKTLVAQGHDLDTLSMGMSGDLELAIACGSTMVRVGTDLFGPRNSGDKQ